MKLGVYTNLFANLLPRTHSGVEEERNAPSVFRQKAI